MEERIAENERLEAGSIRFHENSILEGFRKEKPDKDYKEVEAEKPEKSKQRTI